MPSRLVENGTYLLVLIAGLVLFALSAHLTEVKVGRYVARRWGWRAVLFTGWIGVPLHELSHLLMAKLFGHRVIAWTLWDPDPVSGTLGYVRHAYSKDTLFQRLGYAFVAISPLLAGLGALAALLYWMLPLHELSSLWGRLSSLHPTGSPWLLMATSLPQLMGALAMAIWRQRSGLLPLQLYLAISVSAHMAPSRSDFSAASHGLAAMVFAGLGLTAISAWLELSLAPLVSVLVPLPALWLAVAILLTGYALVVRLTTPSRAGSFGQKLEGESSSPLASAK